MKAEEMLERVDHTLLHAACSWPEICALCEEAIQYHMASVCVPPSYVARIHTCLLYTSTAGLAADILSGPSLPGSDLASNRMLRTSHCPKRRNALQIHLPLVHSEGEEANGYPLAAPRGWCAADHSCASDSRHWRTGRCRGTPWKIRFSGPEQCCRWEDRTHREAASQKCHQVGFPAGKRDTTFHWRSRTA